MRKFFGGLLVGVGLLMAGTTGLCTGAVILSALPALFQQPGQTLAMSPLLLVGIVPCVIGIFIARWGFETLRDDDEI